MTKKTKSDLARCADALERIAAAEERRNELTEEAHAADAAEADERVARQQAAIDQMMLQFAEVARMVSPELANRKKGQLISLLKTVGTEEKKDDDED